jgi:hypothetical protein
MASGAIRCFSSGAAIWPKLFEISAKTSGFVRDPSGTRTPRMS